jgi:hypothetical protein
LFSDSVARGHRGAGCSAPADALRVAFGWTHPLAVVKVTKA